MVLWNDRMGGEFPWDERYYQSNPDTSDGFDLTYIMQHATDSASTAGCMATGHKAAVNMMSQTLYEEDVSTLVEDAMMCGKAGGVVSSVPMFHATPGAFIIHTNSRSDRDSLRRSFEKVNPTFVSGACGGNYYPYPETLESMRSGALSSQWTFLEQKNTTMAEVRQLMGRIVSTSSILLTCVFLFERTFMPVRNSLVWILIMAITSWFASEVISPLVASTTCHTVASTAATRTDTAPMVKLPWIQILVIQLESLPPRARSFATTMNRMKWLKFRRWPTMSKLLSTFWARMTMVSSSCTNKEM